MGERYVGTRRVHFSERGDPIGMNLPNGSRVVGFHFEREGDPESQFESLYMWVEGEEGAAPLDEVMFIRSGDVVPSGAEHVGLISPLLGGRGSYWHAYHRRWKGKLKPILSTPEGEPWPAPRELPHPGGVDRA